MGKSASSSKMASTCKVVVGLEIRELQLISIVPEGISKVKRVWMHQTGQQVCRVFPDPFPESQFSLGQ